MSDSPDWLPQPPPKPPRTLPLWRRVLSLALFTEAAALAMPCLVMAFDAAFRNQFDPINGLGFGAMLVGFAGPAAILLLAAALVRRQRRHAR